MDRKRDHYGSQMNSFFVFFVRRKRDHYGSQMNSIYESMDLAVELSAEELDPLLTIHPAFSDGFGSDEPAREEVRQDSTHVLGPYLMGFFKKGVVDWDAPVAYAEKKLLNVVTMICSALDPIFQETVRTRCEDACGRGQVYTKAGPLKKVARMENKMLVDHRNEVKPRCALQIDIMRCMVGAKGPAELKKSLQALKDEFGGGFVMVKNGFAWSDEKARNRKHLRFINTTILYEPKGMTFGKLMKIVRDKKTASHASWKAFKDTVSGEPSERWEMLTQFAEKYLSSSKMSKKPVKVLAEVQLLIQDYIPIREATTELYKVARCESCNEVKNQFVEAYTTFMEKKLGASLEDMTMDDIGRAARLGQAKTVTAFINSGASPDQTWDRDRTAMFFAAEAGHADCVKLLAENGASPDARTNDNGATPINIAAEKGHFDVVGVLIQLNADINARRYDHQATAVFAAAQNGITDVRHDCHCLLPTRPACPLRRAGGRVGGWVGGWVGNVSCFCQHVLPCCMWGGTH